MRFKILAFISDSELPIFDKSSQLHYLLDDQPEGTFFLERGCGDDYAFKIYFKRFSVSTNDVRVTMREYSWLEKAEGLIFRVCQVDLSIFLNITLFLITFSEVKVQ